MRNEMDYPEYNQLVESHGVEAAIKVGNIIQRLHSGTIAALQIGARMADDLMLVVLVNAMGLIEMERQILLRAIKIMAADEEADEASAEDFDAALREAQRQLREEAATSEAEQAAAEAQPEPAPAAE